MQSRRSKFEIYIDVLTHIKSGETLPTRIMYSANLSWKPLCKLLESLADQELIEECPGDEDDKRTKKAYVITSKGNNVLRYFNQAKSLIEVEAAPSILR